MSPSGTLSVSSRAGFCSLEATDSETYQGATGNNSIPWGRPASLAAHERRRGEANFFSKDCRFDRRTHESKVSRIAHLPSGGRTNLPGHIRRGR